MAIAGLQNVSVPDSSFLRASQSQVSRRRGDEGRASTRASSLLQMWRDLEDEHVVSPSRERVCESLLQQRSNSLITDLSRATVSGSHNSEHSGGSEGVGVGEIECETWSQGQIGSENDHEDNNSSSCENSSDFGDVERERVRQIFREWMNCSMRERTSDVPCMNNSSRVAWLGETEQGRVRIIREWVHMNSQQRGASSDSGEEQAAEIGEQIERVRDGLELNQNEGRGEHIRRGIRRVCGRQALLDMLKKVERERQRELQCLLGQQAVTHFAHRNRIQSLLRGRFLRNDRLIENERPTSMAASELGLLRQRHTVSDLRGGFISRGDSSVYGQVSSNHSDSSSNSHNNDNNEHTEGNCSHEILDDFHEPSEPNNVEAGSPGLSNGRDDLEDNIVGAINLQESIGEPVSVVEVRDWLQSASFESVERRDGSGQGMDGNLQESSANEGYRETWQNEAGDHSHQQEVSVVLFEQAEGNSEESRIHGNTNLQESTAQVQELQEQFLINEESYQQQASVQSNEQRDGVEDDDINGNRLESTANDLSQVFLGSEDREHGHPQEVLEVWNEDSGFQEAVQNWLEGPSDQETDQVARVNSFYLPDDDNYSTELRELLSRRSVSNLLRSGFRESLDQLIQSYVERQGHSPALVEEDLGQQSGDQNEGQGGTENPPAALPLPSMPRSQPIWLNQDHWPQHDMHQRLGIDWEIVNDLRIDMARLQQRMNNMQRMLEACMDMQLELQRSIRQEVSDALNRSGGSPPGMCEDSLENTGSKWDHVRKGICCICCNSNIDSLLYRCGHMCTCSKCANELVERSGKCPMCRAPAVEVIRAYSIL